MQIPPCNDATPEPCQLQELSSAQHGDLPQLILDGFETFIGTAFIKIAIG